MEDEDFDSEEGQLSALREQLTELTDPSTTQEAQTYARRFLNRQLSSPIPEQQGKILTELEKNAEEARNALRAAREKLIARKYNPADKWFALSAALGAPTRVGGIGDLASRSAAALGDVSKKRVAFEESQDKGVLDYDSQIAELTQRLLALKMGMTTEQSKIDAGLAKESLKTLGKRTTGGVQNKAQQAVDREYAKDYLEWVQTGAPDAAKSMEELASSRDRLRGYRIDERGMRIPIKEGDFLTRQLGPTGRVSGTLATVPYAGKALQDILMPSAADIREVVESTVQRSLRPILGAQFTEKEGERLIARVYNPRLKPEVNAVRVQRLLDQLAQAAESKTRAAQHFEKYGTLAGFKGKYNYTIADFMPEDTNELLPPEEEETGNPDDHAPAVDDTGQTVPETAPDGRRIYDVSELPKKRVRKRNILGFAEGGAVSGQEMILVRMPDGSIQEVAADATQEDILGGDDAEGYDSALSRSALAGLGAGTGYLTARAGLGLGTKLGDKLPGRKETPAQARLLRLMERADIPPSGVTGQVRRASRMNVPAMAADVMPDFLSVAETSLPQGGLESSEMLRRLRERQTGARERTADQVNRGLKPDEYFGKEEDLKTRLYGDKRKGIESESGPLYRAAEEQFPTVRSHQLMKLLDTPSGKKAVKAAMKTMEDKRKTIGKVNKVTGAVTRPSLEFLNQVKIEMDDLINKEEAKGATGKGKVLRGLRDAFRAELDTATANPTTGVSPYREARGVSERGKKHLEILQKGREEFGKMQPQEVTKAIGEMDFEQRDAFRTGVAQKLYEMINSPTTDLNAARKLVGSPQMKAKLAPLFDSPAELRVFETALQKEMEIFEHSKKLLNKEGIVRQRGAEPASGAVARGARKAPTLGVFSPTYWALKYLRSKPEIDEKEAAEVIKLLKSQTPEELADFEKTLGKKFGRKAARKRRSSRAGMAGAALGAVTGALMGGDDEEIPEDDPALEGLTDEEKQWAMRPAKAEGGKISKVKELIDALNQKRKQMQMDPEHLKHEIMVIANKVGQTPTAIWNMLRSAPRATLNPTRIPAQPEQLAPFASSMDFEKQRLKQITDSLALRQDLPPARAEGLQAGTLAATEAYDRMMSQPSYDNMRMLSEMVRSLTDQSKRRGGRVRRQFGGMTRHG